MMSIVIELNDNLSILKKNSGRLCMFGEENQRASAAFFIAGYYHIVDQSCKDNGVTYLVLPLTAAKEQCTIGSVLAKNTQMFDAKALFKWTVQLRPDDALRATAFDVSLIASYVAERAKMWLIQHNRLKPAGPASFHNWQFTENECNVLPGNTEDVMGNVFVLGREKLEIGHQSPYHQLFYPLRKYHPVEQEEAGLGQHWCFNLGYSSVLCMDISTCLGVVRPEYLAPVLRMNLCAQYDINNDRVMAQNKECAPLYKLKCSMDDYTCTVEADRINTALEKLDRTIPMMTFVELWDDANRLLLKAVDGIVVFIAGREHK